MAHWNLTTIEKGNMAIVARMSAYLGRTELLRWLNTLCATELTCVEQTSSGAMACQVVDALYPGQIQMNKVDWMATQQHECVHNYKILQQSFTALKIDKHIPVEKLVQGKYQDNLEFLQWLKCFYDSRKAPLQPYDARARRAKGRGGVQYNNKLDGVRMPVKRARVAVADGRTSRPCDVDEIAAVLEKMEKMKIQSEGLTEEKKALMMQINALQETVECVKKERDFYLKKLRVIEELVHEAELSKTTSAQTNLLGLSILDVVYATTEDEEEQELPF